MARLVSQGLSVHCCRLGSPPHLLHTWTRPGTLPLSAEGRESQAAGRGEPGKTKGSQSEDEWQEP